MRISRALHLANKISSTRSQISKVIKYQNVLSIQSCVHGHHVNVYNQRVLFQFCNAKNPGNN